MYKKESSWNSKRTRTNFHDQTIHIFPLLHFLIKLGLTMVVGKRHEADLIREWSAFALMSPKGSSSRYPFFSRRRSHQTSGRITGKI